MHEALGSAHEHIRIMELRIEQQTELIVKLKDLGQDTGEAAHKLVVLRKAMEEMRIQLGMLAPTPMDIRRAGR